MANNNRSLHRKVSPPEKEWGKLRQPLEKGELIVARFFIEFLPDEWEIYIQPHLNGLCPDIVLLHPKAGIAVYEIKDWNLDAIEYYFKQINGKPHLMANNGERHFSKQKDNPVDQVMRYKWEIYNLYCPSLPEKHGLGVITAGIIFPFADDEEVRKLLKESLRVHGMDKYPEI